MCPNRERIAVSFDLETCHSSYACRLSPREPQARDVPPRVDLRVALLSPASRQLTLLACTLSRGSASRAWTTVLRIGMAFLTSKQRLWDIQFRTSAKAEVAQHAFEKQHIVGRFSSCRLGINAGQNGVPVANAVANAAFTGSDAGEVLSFSSSLVEHRKSPRLFRQLQGG